MDWPVFKVQACMQIMNLYSHFQTRLDLDQTNDSKYMFRILLLREGFGKLTNYSKTLLLYAQRHWPEVLTTILWTNALKEVKRRDNILNLNWDYKARVGTYVSHSPDHASSIPLVVKPRLLNVFPQFHIDFDGDFSTVPYKKLEIASKLDRSS